MVSELYGNLGVRTLLLPTHAHGARGDGCPPAASGISHYWGK